SIRPRGALSTTSREWLDRRRPPESRWRWSSLLLDGKEGGGQIDPGNRPAAGARRQADRAAVGCGQTARDLQSEAALRDVTRFGSDVAVSVGDAGWEAG